MTYKDLLVHVDDTKGCAKRIEAAVDLAAAHEAHLTGVYIISEPSPSSFAQGYLPAELSDDELAGLVAGAVEESGAEGVGDIGKVMGVVMPQVDGRADGKRVSDAVRERLGA